MSVVSCQRNLNIEPKSCNRKIVQEWNFGIGKLGDAKYSGKPKFDIGAANLNNLATA